MADVLDERLVLGVVSEAELAGYYGRGGGEHG